jgi:hypothetical protein
MRTKADIRRLLLVMGSRWLHAEGGRPGTAKRRAGGVCPACFLVRAAETIGRRKNESLGLRRGQTRSCPILGLSSADL